LMCEHEHDDEHDHEDEVQGIEPVPESSP
jgi:hypothetical protein